MLSLCVLAACTKRAGQHPTITPSITDRSYGDPARDAQLRLLKEAYRAFIQARYPAASVFFRRFIEDAPNSARVFEARWWLARTHEQLGDYRGAMEQYRMLATEPNSQQLNRVLYEGLALRRLDELRQARADHLNGPMQRLALRVPVHDLPPPTRLTPWFQELAQGGVSAVAIEPASMPSSDSLEDGLDALRPIVNEAHRVGILLWVTVDVHQGKGLDLKQEWRAATIGGLGRERVVSARPDIANGGYQAYLETVIRALSRTGCDGLLLTARPLKGFSEEFSDGSFQDFAMAFGVSVGQDDVIAPTPASNGAALQRPVSYWRWVGWKALSYAKLVMRLRHVLRDTNPTATMLVEVHQTALTSPLEGLEQYGEDLAELMPRIAGSIVVRQEEYGGEAIGARLSQQSAATMERAWLGLSPKLDASAASMGGLSQVIRELVGASPWKNVVIQAGQAERFLDKDR